MVPIFPNIGWSATGKPYNISSNELAMSISKELNAAKLFFLTDFGGIPADGFKLPPDTVVTSEGTIFQLTVGQAGNLIDQNPSQARGTVMEILSLAYNADRDEPGKRSSIGQVTLNPSTALRRNHYSLIRSTC